MIQLYGKTHIWFSKHTYGFQNPNTGFDLTFFLFQNSQHVDDTVKHTFGFENTHTDFKTQIRF